jgi:hypothetical protein
MRLTGRTLRREGQAYGHEQNNSTEGTPPAGLPKVSLMVINKIP